MVYLLYYISYYAAQAALADMLYQDPDKAGLIKIGKIQ